MKKLIISGIAILSLTAAVAFNANLSTSSNLSDVSLANVEALARAELPEVEVSCGKSEGDCWTEGDYLLVCDKVLPSDAFEYYECVRSDDPSNSCYDPCR